MTTTSRTLPSRSPAGRTHGAADQPRDKNPLRTHLSSVVGRPARGRGARRGVRGGAGEAHAKMDRWYDGRSARRLVKIADYATYPAAQQAVSQLIQGDIPPGTHRDRRARPALGRDHGTAGICRRGAFGRDQRRAAGPAVLRDLRAGHAERGDPALFAGVMLVGIAIGMLLSILTYALLRRRHELHVGDAGARRPLRGDGAAAQHPPRPGRSSGHVVAPAAAIPAPVDLTTPPRVRRADRSGAAPRPRPARAGCPVHRRLGHRRLGNRPFGDDRTRAGPCARGFIYRRRERREGERERGCVCVCHVCVLGSCVVYVCNI